MTVIYILKGAVFISRENLRSSIIWVILSAVVCSFPKKAGPSYAFIQRYYKYSYRMLAAIHSFNGNVDFSDINICNYPVLMMDFQHTLEHHSPWNKLLSYIFRAASIMLKREQPLEWATFSQKAFFQNSNYFLLITASW